MASHSLSHTLNLENHPQLLTVIVGPCAGTLVGVMDDEWMKWQPYGGRTHEMNT